MDAVGKGRPPRSRPIALKGHMISNTFRTEDITLVAVFKVKGIECREKERQDGGCVWLFDQSHKLLEIVDEYEAYECCIEPRDFNRKLGLVRRNMYEFLQHRPTRVRRN